MTTANPPRIVLLARDIKLSHTIFAMPFALLAAFLAAAHRGMLPSLPEVGLVVVCMVLARTVAMTINRWADRYLDEHNPRTAARAIPSGRLTARYMLNTAAVCSLAFVTATSGFYFVEGNLWPVLLSPIVLAWLASYSFTKRFTWLCHLILGSALAMSPLAAVVAVEPSYLTEPTPYLLAVMVMCWVAGFDVIYALQDVDSDIRDNLFSMPARLGIERALWISRLLHAISVASLMAVAHTSDVLGIGFRLGVAAVTVLLVIEHAIVWRSKTNHIDVVFFTINGVISVVLGVLGALDILVG